jgi:hypothetical protein
MSATLTVDPKKYARLANRIVVKALDTEEEYDHMVAAVEQLIDKGEDHLSPEESALLETMAILVQAYDDRHHPLPGFGRVPEDFETWAQPLIDRQEVRDQTETVRSNW